MRDVFRKAIFGEDKQETINVNGQEIKLIIKPLPFLELLDIPGVNEMLQDAEIPVVKEGDDVSGGEPIVSKILSNTKDKKATFMAFGYWCYKCVMDENGEPMFDSPEEVQKLTSGNIFNVLLAMHRKYMYGTNPDVIEKSVKN